MNKKTLLALVVLAVFAGAVILIADSNDSEIDSFEDCVAAGNDVMESYPRQCRTADGRLFVEEIDNDIDDENTSQGVTVSGTVTAVDSSQIAADGPLVITLETTDGVEETIAVPSMGIQICAASENLEGAFDVEADQNISVRGLRDSGGQIVPCESADHFLRVHDNENSATLSVDEIATVNDLDITLEEVVQESRCPIDAECIEAGAVTVRVTLADGNTEEEVNIASDDVPYRFGDYQVMITDINPPLVSGGNITQSEYRITFEVIR